MALIRCPECQGEISSTSKLCVHCGYILKKRKAKKESNQKPLSWGSLIFAIVCLVFFICLISHGLEEARINEYRFEFSSEYEMRELLKSGRWKLEQNGLYLDVYVEFNENTIIFVDEESNKTIRIEYELDYENSTILDWNEEFEYDVIYKNHSYYLRQNPKADKDSWILFKLY